MNNEKMFTPDLSGGLEGEDVVPLEQMSEAQKIKSGICPSCGGDLAFQEGCKVCYSCGWGGCS